MGIEPWAAILKPFLRDSPAAQPGLKAEMSRLESSKEPRAQSRLGELLRLQGRLEEARAVLQKVLDDPGISLALEATTRLRYATTLQYLEEYPKAKQEFLRSLELSVQYQLVELEHFIHQHYGKCLVECGELEAGLAELEQARQQRSDQPELLASTLAAIEAVERISPSAPL
jgi:tetratricopeptide (TPR) repeat protein